MRTTDFIIMMALTVFCTSAAFACEPIALNWDQFYALNDQNKDKKIQRSEWQSLNFNGSNYDAGFESSLPRAQIFQQMDKNKNGTLEEQEIYDLGVEHKEIVVGYALGDEVRVTDGPLAGFNGVVDELEPDKNRVRVVVSMFGRETPVDLELDQVEAIKE